MNATASSMLAWPRCRAKLRCTTVTLTVAVGVTVTCCCRRPQPGKLENVGAQGYPSASPRILRISAVVFRLLRLLSGPISRFQSSSPNRAFSCRRVGPARYPFLCCREIPHSSPTYLLSSNSPPDELYSWICTLLSICYTLFRGDRHSHCSRMSSE
ncbi:hypothetical protein F5883DRAFT_558831 [Diaporthe sp. PMI_573]|nr:hypothetical protein F5883DRAFT_558831 [Diaporthaceae sp. PMI_573]